MWEWGVDDKGVLGGTVREEAPQGEMGETERMGELVECIICMIGCDRRSF